MGEAASAESSACLACSARICISGSGLGSAVGAGGRQQLGLKACLWDLGKEVKKWGWCFGVGHGATEHWIPPPGPVQQQTESALCGWLMCVHVYIDCIPMSSLFLQEPIPRWKGTNSERSCCGVYASQSYYLLWCQRPCKSGTAPCSITPPLSPSLGFWPAVVLVSNWSLWSFHVKVSSLTGALPGLLLVSPKVVQLKLQLKIGTRLVQVLHSAHSTAVKQSKGNSLLCWEEAEPHLQPPTRDL